MNDAELQRATARAVRELADDPLPDADWQRIEDAALRRFRTASPVETPGTWRTWAAAAVALAAFIALANAALSPSAPAVATGSLAADAPLGASEAGFVEVSGSALSPGDVVEAMAEPTRVTHAGHSSWVLSPGSSAKIASLGSIVELQLEVGTLSAEVEPSAASRSFVVRAGGATVSVRGTKFVLTLANDLLSVDVTDGVVAVRGTNEKQEAVLRAPAKRTVPAHVAIPTLAPRPPANGTRRAVAPSSTATRQPPAPTHAREDALDRIAGKLRQCYAGQLGDEGETRVAVRTRLMLTIDASGRVSDARFEPPLAPTVLPCARAAVSGATFPSSGAAFRLERDLTFGAD